MTEVLKIATWNINSVRIRMEQLKNWLQRNNIDILLLQEIKCINEQFPLSDIEELGYNCYVHGQKSYNGVAIVSKHPADEVKTNFYQNPCEDEARFIEIGINLNIGYARIINLYVPNGGEPNSEKFTKKLKFYDSLKKYLENRELDENIIIGGDFNVAIEDKDVFSKEEMQNQTCYTIEERKKIRSIINTGLIDCFRLTEDKAELYSWWDYRAGCFQHNKGLRIDYFLTSANVSDLVISNKIDKETRKEEKSSDHAPVILEIQSRG